MLTQFLDVYFSPFWWGYVLRTASFFLLAWVVHRLGNRLSSRLVRLDWFASPRARPSPERRKTLQALIASFITFLAFAAAVLTSLVQFVGPDTLLWMVGLFSAAFGLGARPQLSDFLSGVGFLFEDTFSVGEKVEILGMEGVIEAVNLRTTWMRAPTGELYVIPNGEIRVIRNFSRGQFSTARVRVKIEASQLPSALPLLENLGKEAVNLLPSLLEPWQVLNESGAIGQHAELTIIAHTRFGAAADAQPRLLALVQERLREAGLQLVD